MKKSYFLILIIIQFAFSSDVFAQNTESAGTDVSKISILAFPNPANKSITISIEGIDVSKITIEIFEITGQSMQRIFPENSQVAADVSDFKEGIYFYKAISEGKVIHSEKFIVLKK